MEKGLGRTVTRNGLCAKEVNQEGTRGEEGEVKGMPPRDIGHEEAILEIHDFMVRQKDQDVNGCPHGQETRQMLNRLLWTGAGVTLTISALLAVLLYVWSSEKAAMANELAKFTTSQAQEFHPPPQQFERVIDECDKNKDAWNEVKTQLASQSVMLKVQGDALMKISEKLDRLRIQ